MVGIFEIVLSLVESFLVLKYYLPFISQTKKLKARSPVSQVTEDDESDEDGNHEGSPGEVTKKTNILEQDGEEWAESVEHLEPRILLAVILPITLPSTQKFVDLMVMAKL